MFDEGPEPAVGVSTRLATSPALGFLGLGPSRRHGSKGPHNGSMAGVAASLVLFSEMLRVVAVAAALSHSDSLCPHADQTNSVGLRS